MREKTTLEALWEGDVSHSQRETQSARVRRCVPWGLWKGKEEGEDLCNPALFIWQIVYIIMSHLFTCVELRTDARVWFGINKGEHGCRVVLGGLPEPLSGPGAGPGLKEPGFL